MVVDAVLIPGDDSGPELVAAARRVLDAATGCGIRWVPAEAGAGPHARLGTALPEATVAAVRAIGTPRTPPSPRSTGPRSAGPH